MSVQKLSEQKRDDAYRYAFEEVTIFYKMVITVATSFLGGSILFSDRIVQGTGLVSKRIMVTGWFCLVMSIALIAVVRMLNIKVFHLILNESGDEGRARASEVEKKSLRCTWASVIFLVLGLLFMSASACSALFLDSKGVGMESDRPGDSKTTKSLPTTGWLTTSPSPSSDKPQTDAGGEPPATTEQKK